MYNLPKTKEIGANSYLVKPSGERLGYGYHSYGVLVGATAVGEAAHALIGITGATEQVLGEDAAPITDGHHRLYVEDGVLYGELGSNTQYLGEWPPEQAISLENFNE